MLSKPGEARKSSTPSQRRRKVVEENLDDVVRRLQRLPPNKACADCTSKPAANVNLTHGTFVCTACAGVHREFNHKIKGIGHSSFAADEVAKLRHPSAGNEAVNAHYLAKYITSDRMRAPKNNADLQHLRSWIQKKYIEKNWCESKGGSGGGTGGAARPPAKAKGRNETGRRKIMPKAKDQPRPSRSPQQPPSRQQPPPPKPISQGAADLFEGFDSGPTAGKDESWDAFGGSSASNGGAQGFQADFGGANGSAPPATAPPAAAPPAFQDNFGSFPPQQQPTVVSLPPQQPQQQNPPQQQQQAFRANFGQAPVQHHPGQMTQQQNATQGGGFASFPSVQQPTPPRQQQQPLQQTQNAGFANFSPQQNQFPQLQQQMQQQPSQNNAQMQGAGAMNKQQGGMDFGQFPHQQQPPPQMQQQPQQNGQQGFANFGSVTSPQQSNQFPQQQQMPPAQGQMVRTPNAQTRAGGSVDQPQGSVPQQQSPPQMQPQPNGQQDFANFGSAQPPQQQNQFPPKQQMPPGQAPSAHISGGGSTNQSQGSVPQQQPPPQMQPQQQTNGQQGFANFGSAQPPQSNNQFPQKQQMAPAQVATGQAPSAQISGGGFTMQQNVQTQGSGGDTNKEAQLLQQQPSVAQPAPGTGGEHSAGVKSGSGTETNTDRTAPPPAPAPPGQQLRNESEHSATMNPNAFQATDDSRKSAFDDAFGGLSLEPTPPAYGMAGASGQVGAAASSAPSKNLNFAPYKEGQKVTYSNSEGSCLAIVTKVHFDDELNPYYTINLNGREKQTDDSHLTVADDSAQNLGNSGMSGLLQETVSMLQQLDSQQLLQVKQFVASLVSGSSSLSASSSGQMNATNHGQMHQMSFGSMESGSSLGNGIPATSMGGAAPTPPTPAQFSGQKHPNHGAQQQALGMGAPAPPPSMPSRAQSAPFSMQQPQPMGMGMDAAAPTPPSAMPPPPPAQAPTPTQFSMQEQQPNPGIQQQAMGMSPATAPALTQFSMQQPNQGMPQQSMGMLPAAPGQASAPGQFSMQQHPQGAPQQPMGMRSPAMPAAPGQATGHFPAPQQPTHNQGVPQQPMGTGPLPVAPSPAMPPPPPAVAASPALPPVEKEGNPFDFY